MRLYAKNHSDVHNKNKFESACHDNIVFKVVEVNNKKKKFAVADFYDFIMRTLVTVVIFGSFLLLYVEKKIMRMMGNIYILKKIPPERQ